MTLDVREAEKRARRAVGWKDHCAECRQYADAAEDFVALADLARRLLKDNERLAAGAPDRATRDLWVEAYGVGLDCDTDDAGDPNPEPDPDTLEWTGKEPTP